MKQYKGAVFFDVDGTLVDERLKIYHPTPKTAEAIGRLRIFGRDRHRQGAVLYPGDRH